MNICEGVTCSPISPIDTSYSHCGLYFQWWHTSIVIGHCCWLADIIIYDTHYILTCILSSTHIYGCFNTFSCYISYLFLCMDYEENFLTFKRTMIGKFCCFCPILFVFGKQATTGTNLKCSLSLFLPDFIWGFVWREGIWGKGV